MFGRVKRWLGIEGVKLELDVPGEVREKEGAVEGVLRFYSMNAQTVTHIKVVMIEHYSRGRGKEKLIDEYELGDLDLFRNIEIPAHEEVEVPFRLPFTLIKSDVDSFGDRNLLFGGLANLARLTRNARSEFRLEAEARVKGTALNPFDKKQIHLK